MKSNLGQLDRILRFALAFWWLGPWAPSFPYEMDPYGWANALIFVVGLIALIESFVGWCWLHTAFRIDNRNQ